MGSCQTASSPLAAAIDKRLQLVTLYGRPCILQFTVLKRSYFSFLLGNPVLQFFPLFGSQDQIPCKYKNETTTQLFLFHLTWKFLAKQRPFDQSNQKTNIRISVNLQIYKSYKLRWSFHFIACHIVFFFFSFFW